MSKVIFITGGSRGIGREIALKFAAKDKANIVIAAKTAEPHPKLEGTIYSVANEIEELGGKALPLMVDVRDEQQIQNAITKTIETFGRLDVLVNNASAINLTDTLNTPMKRYDLMQSVNARATFACSQAAIPYLLNSENPHILTLSPPLNMDKTWFAPHLAYTISKYGMSMCTLGLAEEFKEAGIAVNSLWPKTTIATDAIRVHFPSAMYMASRKPQIMADAAYWIINQSPKSTTGNFFIDEDVLRNSGVTDFSCYAMNPKAQLCPDLFL
ncbi:TPA: SDR family NAD(P)-dependent oxidoreductase [Legionella pneumophila]|uniref:Short chain dehydrogenase n=1 Tax=Legionella pneumophila TaxID=446 RepID=A0A2S6EZ74_LEGPN|nr:NAD(P)-dependent oxidoreductase [Legionella pneumophila]APF03027.1 short chain dehydrogenase [Legionella pneumophila subsp. fraseri]APF06057.1 short chain dehydrogenase [Legionella pneumophila subsp. fraseri]KXB24232.1 short-chain dehydrogenase [Legionella pneumophila]KXB26146.1 short-chain dehydrogenase [Legionella pneumophila]KZX34480.1 short-chain dehydrogenase [Legionella pneumophila]